MTTRIKAIITGAATLAIIPIGTYEAFKWSVMRVYVPPDKALVITNKFGDSLPADRITVPAGESRFKGVREEILGPGRYFFNPCKNPMYSSMTSLFIVYLILRPSFSGRMIDVSVSCFK